MPTQQSETHANFTRENFPDAVAADLNQAKGIILIKCPFVWIRRIEIFGQIIQNCSLRGVQICFFLDQLSETATEQQKREYAAVINLIGSWNVHITYHENFHEKLIVIDEDILWSGSINTLSYSKKSEWIDRWCSKSKVAFALLEYKMGSCSVCFPDGRSLLRTPSSLEQVQLMLATGIENRRDGLQISQRQLAARINVSQPTISRIETGQADPPLSMLVRVLHALHLEVRIAPPHLIPSIDGIIKNASVLPQGDVQTKNAVARNDFQK